MPPPALRSDIQGLRAIAVALVIAFHLPAAISFRGGFVGVDIFFVISGFVVTKMILGRTAPASSAWSAAAQFLQRRALRLVPALSVVVAATILLAILFAPTAELGGDATAGLLSQLFVSNGYYAGNFDTYWDPAVLRSPFLHMWSLGVEFQTYLVFPLIFSLLLRPERSTPSRQLTVLTITLVLAAVSLAVFVALLILPAFPVRGFSSQALAFYSPVTRFWEFALGIVPAILSRTRGWESRRRIPGLGWVAGALTAAGIVGCAFGETIGLAVIPACVGTALLLISGERRVDARWSPLEARPLTWIGDRSYSIYLWHWPFLVLALWLYPGNLLAALAAVAAAVLAATFTYRDVELRFRRSSQSGWRALRPTALFAAAGLVLSLVGLQISGAAWYVAPTPLASAAMDFPDDGRTAADMQGMLARCDLGPIEIHCLSATPRPEVVVIGDSLAYRALPAVALAADEHGYDASMLWTGGCGIEAGSCPDFIYDYLATHDVVAIIVAANFDRPADRVNAVELASGEVPVCAEPTVQCAAHQAAVSAFVEAAGPGLQQLDGYADHLLVSLPFPQQAQAVETCLSPPLAQRIAGNSVDPQTCGRTSRSWQIARQGLFPAAIREAVDRDPHAELWDPMEYLCTTEWCPSVINDGDLIIQDGIHWSWDAARLLYPAFDRYLDEIDR